MLFVGLKNIKIKVTYATPLTFVHPVLFVLDKLSPLESRRTNTCIAPQCFSLSAKPANHRTLLATLLSVCKQRCSVFPGSKQQWYVSSTYPLTWHQWRTEGGLGCSNPPKILKALQNRTKHNSIVKTVKNCWIYDANTPRCSKKRQ